MDRLYDLDDITLIPRVVSTIKSRDEIKPSVELFPGVTLTVPIIASPMMDVCDGMVAKIMRELGGFGFIHRFQSIGDQVAQFYASEKKGGCAVGLGPEGMDRFLALYAAGCRYFCLDIANGASSSVHTHLEAYKRYKDAYWILGNVASIEGYRYCNAPPNVNGVRISVGSGGACETTKVTGVYHPTASLIKEIAQNKNLNSAKLIADGGISNPGRFCKALALGTDCVMMGSALAVAKESPAIKVDSVTGPFFKGETKATHAKFRGSASFEVQKEYREPRYVEGKEVLLPYSGKSLEEIVRSYMDGLRSSMSYFNARTLEEYRNNVTYGVLK